ncbi:MAG: S-layer homology domain-containing protein [Clostridiales bacterium]|nr:S-layer homology domain-containing protein [Clostridiales bacterium]
MKKLSIAVILLITFALVGQVHTIYAAEDFDPHPSTAYAGEFIAKCEGQQWFINEVEKQLNLEEKTINNATGTAYFNSIVSLGLTDKGVTGKLPKAIGELKELKHIFLSKNQLEGPIIPELLTMAKLVNLDLSQNKFEGAIPADINKLSNLQTLILWDNELTGVIPVSLGNMPNLLNLDVSNNYLTGSIPTEIGNISTLTFFGASQNSLSGTIPDSLSNLRKLKGLSIWSNGLTGGIPISLGNLSELQVLDISHNPNLGGEIPTELSNCTELIRLGAANCKLSGGLPNSLQDLTKLEIMDFSSNGLRGQIPVFLGTPMPKLTEIYLNDNKFVGYAPAGMIDKQQAGGIIQFEENYLTGIELKGLIYNKDNFTDGALSMQNQLYMAHLYSPLGTSLNVYPRLQHFTVGTQTANTKQVLWPTEYICTVISNDDSDDSDDLAEPKVEITIDTTGIYIKPLQAIPLSAPVVIEIQIKHNDDSNYSTARFNFTTEAPRSGGSTGSKGTSDKPVTDGLPLPEEHKGYITGFPDGTFKPNSNATREQFVAIMVRVLEKEEITSGKSYPDVKENWAANYIRTSKHHGWISGYPDGTFRPANNITRAEVTAILYRIFLAEDDPTLVIVEKDFPDISGHWAEEYIKKVTGFGDCSGYPDGTFRPNSPISRAELVVMVNKMFKRQPSQESIAKFKSAMNFSDVSESFWGYSDILEAYLSHKYNYEGEYETWHSLSE